MVINNLNRQNKYFECTKPINKKLIFFPAKKGCFDQNKTNSGRNRKIQ